MSKTLNRNAPNTKPLKLIDRLFTHGASLARLGRSHDAERLLTRLASFRCLPNRVHHETQYQLAELALGRRDFKQARRRIAAALAHQPDRSDYHHLMAIAVEEDPDVASERAGRHYQRALALDPGNPVYLADYGSFLLEMGEVERGLDSLRQAVELTPDDVEILGVLAEALRHEGHFEEAERLLRLALFRNSRDRRFRDLWQHHQFQVLHLTQQKVALTPEAREADRPVLLPFVRPAHKKPTRTVGRKVIRFDGPATLPASKQSTHRKPQHRKNAK